MCDKYSVIENRPKGKREEITAITILGMSGYRAETCREMGLNQASAHMFSCQ